MIAVDYKTKRGGLMKRPMAESEEEMTELLGSNEGFCLLCGADGQAAEPDAEKYECESCGAGFVYGYEQLLLMGLFDIQEEE